MALKRFPIGVQDFAVLREDGKYYVADLESGRKLSLSDFREVVPEIVDVSIDVHGNYAYIEITVPNTNIQVTISFLRASLMERVTFVSWYYYL